MHSNLNRFNDSNVTNTQFSAIKPTFLQDASNQYPQGNSKVSHHQSQRNKYSGISHAQSKMTQNQPKSQMQSQNHFHNMLKSGNQSDYQEGGVLNNLMFLGNNQSNVTQKQSNFSNKMETQSRFKQSNMNPAQMSQDQAVHLFMNSNISNPQGKSGTTSMPYSNIKMKFDPIQEDHQGELMKSNKTSKGRD
jgi:hypothetical protein